MSALITILILAGALLMVCNIWGFLRFARYVRNIDYWGTNNTILYFPIVLLVMFLIGYLIVGLFGKPDIIMAGILFGGSIFVFVMYRMLTGVTARIMESEELKTKLTAAQESEKTKTEFLATVSHEMRTPLNVILGLDNLALRNQELPEETKDYLKKIRLSAKHLLTLINNMLDMKRIDTDGLSAENAEFSLREALDQVCAITEAQCLEKGIQFETEISPEAKGKVIGDDALLEQILLSILDNAVKYTERGGVIRFSAALDSEKENLFRFVTEDNGIGMDSAFLPKLFMPFSREDSSSTSRYGGGGLSLSVAKHMADAMHAEILAESEKNRGSKFTVLVPLERTASVEAVSEKEAALEGRRVLIVEDIPENAEIVMDLLELEGVESDLAANGKIGVECFASKPEGYYDAIFMDMRMPVMDGVEATKAIRALERADAKEVPIIALTANSFESDIKQTIEAGMNIHIAKPADADQLYSILGKMISEHPQKGASHD